MSLPSAIRIILYLGLTYFLIAQPLTLVSGLCAAFCLIMAVVIGVLDYYAQVSYTEPKKTGMWCRMCGGACDLENCGMEQP